MSSAYWITEDTLHAQEDHGYIQLIQNNNPQKIAQFEIHKTKFGAYKKSKSKTKTKPHKFSKFEDSKTVNLLILHMRRIKIYVIVTHIMFRHHLLHLPPTWMFDQQTKFWTKKFLPILNLGVYQCWKVSKFLGLCKSRFNYKLNFTIFRFAVSSFVGIAIRVYLGNQPFSKLN